MVRRTPLRPRHLVCMASALSLLLLSCESYGPVRVPPPPDKSSEPAESVAARAAPGLDPIPRYGGTVLVSKGMPANQNSAYYREQ